jgi:hypothetical protein
MHRRVTNRGFSEVVGPRPKIRASELGTAEPLVDPTMKRPLPLSFRSSAAALFGVLLSGVCLCKPANCQEIAVRHDYPDNNFALELSADIVQTIHVLMVCDTDDAVVGRTVEHDLNAMKSFFENGVAGTGCRLDLRVLSGPDAQPSNITTYYDALESGKNDALVFYYSGHGGCDADRVVGMNPAAGTKALWESHYLSMGKRKIVRKRIRDAMEAKPHQLIVMLSDCCSDRVSMPGKGPGSNALGTLIGVDLPPETRSVDKTTFTSLFLRSVGVFDITAGSIPNPTMRGNQITKASSGQNAICNPEIGGVFTHVLLQLMAVPPSELTKRSKYKSDVYVDWFQMFGPLQWGTYYFRLGLNWSILDGPRRLSPAELKERARREGRALREVGEQRPFPFRLGP